jgi:hypothetical protein
VRRERAATVDANTRRTTFTCDAFNRQTGVADALSYIDWVNSALTVVTLGHPKREHIEELARSSQFHRGGC